MTTPRETELARGPAPARANLVLGAAGLALCFAGPFVWIATLDAPILMRTGAAAWLCIAAGLALCFFAARRDGRRRVRAFAWASVAFTLLFAWGAFGLARLPRAEQARASERAPEFDLADHNGKPVRLSDELERGPVLLVFFRGSW